MKHYNKFSIRFTAFLLALLLLAVSPLCYAASLSEMNKEQANLVNRKNKLQKELAALAVEESQKEEYQAVLSEQIETVEQQVDNARRNIETLNSSISALEVSLEAAEKEIDETMELLKKRLAILYAAGKVSTLEILFNAESLHDFTVRSEIVTRITRHDRQLIEQVSDYMQKTAAERAELEAEKAALAENKKQLETSQIELEELIAENNVLLAEIRSEKGSIEAELARTEQEAYSLANMIADFLEQKRREEEAAKATPTPSPTPKPTATPEPSAEPSASPSAEPSASPTPSPTPDPDATPTPEPSAEPTPVPEEEEKDPPAENFCWPLPGYSTITDSFGNGHYGLDVGAPRGTPIVASRSGTVMIANSTDEWGNSWGYHVSIYHDEDYSSLYAHMSEVAVSSGQWVNKGDIIGYVGNTGYSFGNHLHFEIYEGSTRVDPQDFV